MDFIRNIRRFYQIFYLLMLAGLWDTALGSTLLAGWKQLLIVYGFILCAYIKKSEPLSDMFDFFALLQLFLIATSLVEGVTLEGSFYNIFYYSSWVPFFIWAAHDSKIVTNINLKNYVLIMLLIGAVGLAIDFTTDFFHFLRNHSDEIDVNYYIIHHEAARVAFIFTTSTLVMPVMGGLSVLLLLNKTSYFRIALVTSCLIVSIITSGSLSATMIAILIFIGILLSAFVSFRSVIYISSFVLISISIVNYAVHNQNVETQIDRIINNTNDDSEANIGRHIYWEEAIDVMNNMSVMEMIAGNGLGTTNSNHNDSGLILPHGESSFFQAFIECGIIGVILRLAPFVLIASTYKLAIKNRCDSIVYLYSIGILLAVSLAPIFGNIPSQALLGILCGYLYNKKSRRICDELANI